MHTLFFFSFAEGGRLLRIDTYNVNYTAYGEHCHIQDIFRARVIKSQLEGQPLLIAKPYRLPVQG